MIKDLYLVKTIKDKHNEIIITAVNAKQLDLVSENKPIIIYEKDGSIAALQFNEYTVHIGDSFDIIINKENCKKSNYLISRIENKSKLKGENFFSLYVAKTNKTSIYLMPMLGGVKNDYFFDQYLINCYLYDDLLYLKYRFFYSDNYKEFEKFMLNHKYFKAIHDIENNYVLFIMNIPDDYKKEIVHFLNSKYSLFSDTYKLQILKFHNLKERKQETFLASILAKTDKYRKFLERNIGVNIDKFQELESKVKIEEELYNLANQ